MTPGKASALRLQMIQATEASMRPRHDAGENLGRVLGLSESEQLQ